MTAFLTIFRRFPTTFRRFFICLEGQMNVPEYVPKISEDLKIVNIIFLLIQTTCSCYKMALMVKMRFSL